MIEVLYVLSRIRWKRCSLGFPNACTVCWSFAGERTGPSWAPFVCSSKRPLTFEQVCRFPTRARVDLTGASIHTGRPNKAAGRLSA